MSKGAGLFEHSVSVVGPARRQLNTAVSWVLAVCRFGDALNPSFILVPSCDPAALCTIMSRISWPSILVSTVVTVSSQVITVISTILSATNQEGCGAYPTSLTTSPFPT